MAKVVESAKNGLVDLIKIVLLIGALFAVIAFAKASPDTFQAVVQKMMDTAAALIIWVCDQIQKALPASSSTG